MDGGVGFSSSLILPLSMDRFILFPLQRATAICHPDAHTAGAGLSVGTYLYTGVVNHGRQQSHRDDGDNDNNNNTSYGQDDRN